MAGDNQGPESGITPHIAIRERRGGEALDFYQRAFGAELLHRQEVEDGRVMHAHLKINGGSLMLADDFPEYHGRPWSAPEGVTLHLQVEDADRWFERAVSAGATVTMALENQFWGDRYGQVQDPFGHRWSIGGPATGA